MPKGIYKHEQRKPIKKRFLEKIEKTNKCWIWTACKDKKGYGQLRLDQEKGHRLAHRLSWEIYKGPIPKGLNVLHKCDNPPCVRPSHLFLGTIADNNRDMRLKKRHNFGEKNAHAKLTWSRASEIRSVKEKIDELKRIYEVYKESKKKYHYLKREIVTIRKEFSKRFDIGQSQISEIIHGKTWIN